MHAYRSQNLLESDGLFDITLGRQLSIKKCNDRRRAKHRGATKSTNRPAIHCVEAGREIDLGGLV